MTPPKAPWVLNYEHALSEHYGEPVRPVSEYCQGFRDWLRALRELVEREPDEEGIEQYKRIVDISFNLELAITKSNLLYRLIYMGEPLRTEQCPIHRGHWSGYGECQNDPPCNSGLDITGWLPN